MGKLLTLNLLFSKSGLGIVKQGTRTEMLWLRVLLEEMYLMLHIHRHNLGGKTLSVYGG